MENPGVLWGLGYLLGVVGALCLRRISLDKAAEIMGMQKEAFLTLLGAIGVDYSYGSPTCSRAPNISVRAAYNKQKKRDPPPFNFTLFTFYFFSSAILTRIFPIPFLYLNYTCPMLKLYSLCCATLTYFFILLRSAQGRFGVVILAG